MNAHASSLKNHPEVKNQDLGFDGIFGEVGFGRDALKCQNWQTREISNLFLSFNRVSWWLLIGSAIDLGGRSKNSLSGVPIAMVY